MADEKKSPDSAAAGRPVDVDAKISAALAAHLQSPEFAAKVKEIAGHDAPGVPVSAAAPDPAGIVKILIEHAEDPSVVAAFRKRFAEYDELRPDALRKYRPGTPGL